jgi:hypothetical protein
VNLEQAPAFRPGSREVHWPLQETPAPLSPLVLKRQFQKKIRDEVIVLEATIDFEEHEKHCLNNPSMIVFPSKFQMKAGSYGH